MKPQTLKGFRDLLPAQMNLRLKVIDTCRSVFESFGFEPLETPSIEYSSTLLEKYGEEADKLVYSFKDNGEREVGLIYDLTVPTAKVLSMYQNDIPLPFKRYQIQRVWRADKPQRGRYREFTQCDIDIFGVKSPRADAEIITIIDTVLHKLGIKNFSIKVNSRQILFQILKKAGIENEKQQLSILQTIDKLDKKPREEVALELEKKGFSKKQADEIFGLLDKAKIEDDTNLLQVVEAAKSMGVKNYRFVPHMVRGLNYYTGTIFETVVEGVQIGSITAGGRYDHLIAKLGGPEITGIGTTFGFDRICDVIEELGLQQESDTVIKVLVTIFPGCAEESNKIVAAIRGAGINCEAYLEEKDINKQMKYADRKRIPYVIIAGPEEIKNNVVKLKDMKTHEQKEQSVEEVIKFLS